MNDAKALSVERLQTIMREEREKHARHQDDAVQVKMKEHLKQEQVKRRKEWEPIMNSVRCMRAELDESFDLIKEAYDLLHSGCVDSTEWARKVEAYWDRWYPDDEATAALSAPSES